MVKMLTLHMVSRTMGRFFLFILIFYNEFLDNSNFKESKIYGQQGY